MSEPRFTVVEVQLPKSGNGWGVYDAKQKQVVNTSRSRLDMQEWSDAMNIWELNRGAMK